MSCAACSPTADSCRECTDRPSVADAVRPPSAAPIPAADGELRSKHFTSTRNACKLCTPLGACLVYRGVEGCIPFLHGSQGCSTYIRRYLISHFREPMDIASSNFHEDSAIFGGSKNFQQGALNITRQYQPLLIGAATTCLTETIGEDMPRLLHELRQNHGEAAAPIVHASTPSYRGTHIDGFHAAVKALVEQIALAGQAVPGPEVSAVPRINLFPGMVSAADLRHLKEILGDFGLAYTLLPDYSESMDGETWGQYEKIQSGGTTRTEITATPTARTTIEFGRTLTETETAGVALQNQRGVPRRLLGMPIGIRETDALFAALAEVSGRVTPVKYQRERGRLVDSLIDGHKYVFEKRAIVYGDEDLVVGLTAFLCEAGITPALCATGARSHQFAAALRAAAPNLPTETLIKEGLDFAETTELAPDLRPDFLIGSSKGYQLARSLDVPLIRVGFPIHDRIGGQRVLHFGYRGAQELYDRIVNSLLEHKQDYSTIGYSYL